MITLDTSGELMALQTRPGVDLNFVMEFVQESGAPVDLTGSEIVAKIFDSNDQEIVLDTETDESTVTVLIPSSVTAALPSLCRYSVTMIDSDDVVTGLFYGNLSVHTGYPS